MKNEIFPSCGNYQISVNLRNRRFLSILSIFMLFAFMNLTVGCRYYYKVTPTYGELSPEIETQKSQQKFFIVHFGDDAWWLKNLTISEDKTELKGSLEKLPPSRLTYLDTNPDGINRYQPKSQRGILQEVHIYATEYAEAGESMISIPFSAIQKIDVYDPAQGATIASWVFGIVGTILAVWIVLAIIVLLTKDSCPFIYTFNGEHFVFAGEIFSGAIRPNLERHDYLKLPDLKPYDDQYLIRVTNEVKEIQHINMMQLLVIDHPENTQVLFDKYGQIQTVVDPVPPKIAETFSGFDVFPMISEKDSHIYLCDDAGKTDTSLDGVVLTFEKPENVQEGKLIIRAKNSFWLEQVVSSFYEMFGSRYNAFSKKEERKPREELREMMFNQGLPLSVYLEKDGKWELQDYYEIAGPMAMKDDILSINLEGIEAETFKVKLETGFLFWEIDYVAMDFTENIPFEYTTVPVSKAVDERGNDLSAALKYDDQLYYVQPEVGNEADLTFRVPLLKDDNRTIILHSKGHYKILKDQVGKADWRTLKTFREPGRMQQFSKELYEQLIEVAHKE